MYRCIVVSNKVDSVYIKCVHLIGKYRRILSIKSLSEVENPWKGISLNRCILVAIAIVVLSSGAEIVQGECISILIKTFSPAYKIS